MPDPTTPIAPINVAHDLATASQGHPDGQDRVPAAALAQTAAAIRSKSPAEGAYDRLVLYIRNFESQLDAMQEVAMGFAGYAERYVALLEAWLVRSTDEILGEHDAQGPFIKCGWLWQRFIEKPTLVFGKKRDDNSFLNYFPGLHNLALLELFGFVRVTAGKPQPGKMHNHWLSFQTSHQPPIFILLPQQTAAWIATEHLLQV